MQHKDNENGCGGVGDSSVLLGIEKDHPRNRKNILMQDCVRESYQQMMIMDLEQRVSFFVSGLFSNQRLSSSMKRCCHVVCCREIP
jgi:hypothetical protein